MSFVPSFTTVIVRCLCGCNPLRIKSQATSRRSLVTKHHDRVLSDKTLTGCVKGRQEIAHAPTKEKKGRPHGTQRRGSFYQIWCIRRHQDHHQQQQENNRRRQQIFEERKQELTRVRIKRSSSIHNSTQLASELRTAAIQKTTEPQQEHPSPFLQQERKRPQPLRPFSRIRNSNAHRLSGLTACNRNANIHRLFAHTITTDSKRRYFLLTQLIAPQQKIPENWANVRRIRHRYRYY